MNCARLSAHLAVKIVGNERMELVREQWIIHSYISAIEFRECNLGCDEELRDRTCVLSWRPVPVWLTERVRGCGESIDMFWRRSRRDDKHMVMQYLLCLVSSEERILPKTRLVENSGLTS